MSTNQPTRSSATRPEDRLFINRRQSARVPLMVPAWIWRDKVAEPTAIRLLDQSEEGVGFVCPMALAIGEHLELARERDASSRMSLRVAYCEFYSAETFRVGARV